MLRSFLPTRDGRGIVVAGLSAENVERVVRGEPILAKVSEFGEIPDGLLAKDLTLMIAYGETEEELKREIQASMRAALQSKLANRMGRPPR